MRDQDSFIVIQQEPRSTKANFVKPIVISVVIIILLCIAGLVILALNPRQERTSEQIEEDERAALAAYIGTTEMQELYKKLLGKEVVIAFMQSDYFKDDDKFHIGATTNESGAITREGSSEYITFHITNDEIDTPDTAVDFVLHDEVDGQDTYIMQSGENTYQFFNGSVTTEYDKLEYAFLDHQLLREQ